MIDEQEVQPSHDIAQDFAHPVVKRFLKMVGRPDLRAELPEQYEKHWENKGRSGIVRMLHFRITDQPCEITFSLFFDNEDVIQTGIVIKYQGEPLLNEVQKGDSLSYRETRRIDPIAFLKLTFPNAGPGLPTESQSFALAVDDDSEEQTMRALVHLTGKSEPELRTIWHDLLATNDRLRGIDRVSPIIKSWLKKERDRIDLQYLRFAELLLPRSAEVLNYAMGTHTCVVSIRQMSGRQIRALTDAANPEWWGGTFFGMLQGQLTRIPHDPNDRVRLISGLSADAVYPIEEIFIDNRHIYSALPVGEEALVFRTLHAVPTNQFAGMPAVEPAPTQKESILSRLKPKPAAPESDSAPPEPTAPEAHPYLVARAEKAYMAALQAHTPELRTARKEFIRLTYENNPRQYAGTPAELTQEILSAAEQALGTDAGAIQREATLVEAYVTVFFDEM